MSVDRNTLKRRLEGKQQTIEHLQSAILRTEQRCTAAIEDRRDMQRRMADAERKLRALPRWKLWLLGDVFDTLLDT